MPDRNLKLRPATIAAQGTGRVAAPYREIVPPIHVSTTYERGADGAYPGGRVYSRADNPSYDQAEALIASLEGAAAAMLFASGQAAAAALFQSLTPGDAVLAPRSMYWALRKWLLEYASPWGLAVEFYENSSIDDLAQKARTARPRLIFISSTGVYAEGDGEEVDEASPTESLEESGRVLLTAAARSRLIDGARRRRP